MHKSVLYNEVIDGLNINPEGKYIDATLGYGGHSSGVLGLLNEKGFLFAFDQDDDAIKYSNNVLKQIGNNYEIIKSNFLYLKEELEKRNIKKVNGILFDLGVSSPQLDNAERGFSYHADAKLDMRMDQDNKLSAYEVVNNYSEKDLARIIFTYGEEKYAKSIARNIVRARESKNIETTFELVDIIKKSMPYKDTLNHHPARRTFQAIRIEVNHELDILTDSLKKGLEMLDIGGRMVVISFHSLEDNIVKKVFNEYSKEKSFVKGLPNIPEEYLPDFKIINKKPITPSDKELEENNRSRSAKLRIIERIK